MFNGLRPTQTQPPFLGEGEAKQFILKLRAPSPRPQHEGVRSLPGPTRRIRYLEQSVIESFRGI